jgi:hypothetical protein
LIQRDIWQCPSPWPGKWMYCGRLGERKSRPRRRPFGVWCIARIWMADWMVEGGWQIVAWVWVLVCGLVHSRCVGQCTVLTLLGGASSSPPPPQISQRRDKTAQCPSCSVSSHHQNVRAQRIETRLFEVCIPSHTHKLNYQTFTSRNTKTSLPDFSPGTTVSRLLRFLRRSPPQSDSVDSHTLLTPPFYLN